MNRFMNLHKVVFAAGFFAATMLFLLVVFPENTSTVISQSNWGPINNQASLNGTNLTYYPAPSAQQCQSDCNGNPKCKGFTFIRAGAYNPQDQAMCYLASEVTGSVASSCCISAVKNTGGGTGGYIGCYKDTSAFDLNGLLVRSRTNTPQSCKESCRVKGFAFAGVQYGESCLCGNSYGKYGPANNCNMRCTGDSGQICGGINANGIFSTGAVAGGGCPTDYAIQAPSSAVAGSRIKIRFGWRGTSPATQAWIGLMKAGTNQYVEWYGVKAMAETGCEYSFAAPARGSYEFRYYDDGGYDKVMARAPITIQ